MSIRKHKCGLLFLFFITLCVMQARAQVDTLRRLTLEDAVRTAVRNNSELNSARLEVKRSDARVVEAWGYALPSLDFSGNYTRTVESPIFFANFNGEAQKIEMGLPHSLNMTLIGRQILFNGAVIVGVGAAKVYSKLAREIYAGKEVEIVADVRKAYYGVLLAREAARMMNESLKNAEDNLRNVLLLRKQGIVSEYDELRASVQVENLRPAVIRSDNNYSLALDALFDMIGTADGKNYVIVDSLVFEAVEDSLVERAEGIVAESNPGLRALDLQIELNQAAVWAERSNYLPTIAAFGQYQYQSAKNRFTFSAEDLIRSSQVGITVSLNIFQGMQTSARVEQAKVERMKSEEQKVNLGRSLKTGVHSVRGTLDQARKRIAAQEKTVETAQRGYKIVTARFLANAATQLEVNDADLALTQAKVNRIQAIYDYLVAAADLDKLLGRIPGYAAELKENEN